MITLNEKALSFLNTIRRQKSLMFGSILACSVLSMISFRFVPKSFKAEATITIVGQYFQIPLVRDFVEETHDSAELRAQREAAIRLALNQEYLRELGNRFGLFGTKAEDEITTYDLDQLGKKFDVIGVGSGSYLIGHMANNADLSYRIIQDFIGHLRKSLVDQRRTTLVKVRDALQDQLEELSFGKQSGGSGGATLMRARPDLVKQEMEHLQEEIRDLRMNYSDKHPRIAELSKRLSELSRWQKPDPELRAPVRAKTFVGGGKVDDESKELYHDLLRKFHYLEVAIALDKETENTYLQVLQEPFVPKAALWPKRPIFLIWGIAVGFLIGSVLILGSEVLKARLASSGAKDGESIGAKLATDS
jgi:uncharacterized protein involved in exopolysaccharide biosynthesis